MGKQRCSPTFFLYRAPDLSLDVALSLSALSTRSLTTRLVRFALNVLLAVAGQIAYLIWGFTGNIVRFILTLVGTTRTLNVFLFMVRHVVSSSSLELFQLWFPR
jgi:hypothetical protein